VSIRRGELVERVEHALSERDDTQRALLLAVRLGLPVREDATHVDESRSVDVSPLERDPLFRPKPQAGDDHESRPNCAGPASQSTSAIASNSSFFDAERSNGPHLVDHRELMERSADLELLVLLELEAAAV
jgi:hypothetical protein